MSAANDVKQLIRTIDESVQGLCDDLYFTDPALPACEIIAAERLTFHACVYAMDAEVDLDTMIDTVRDQWARAEAGDSPAGGEWKRADVHRALTFYSNAKGGSVAKSMLLLRDIANCNSLSKLPSTKFEVVIRACLRG